MLINHYDILDVSCNASTDEIKKAFRVKAKLLHPDVNKTADATEQFRQVNASYEVLTDTNKRYLFDLQLDSVNRKKRRPSAAAASQAHRYTSSKADPNFHYDWRSISRAANTRKRAEDDDHLIANSFIRHMLFIMSMMVGGFIVSLTAWAIWYGHWPRLCGLAGLPGLFMIREGWKALTDQKTWFASLFRRPARA